MRGFCDSSTHPEFTLGPWEASWRDGSLTSIDLGVDKRVHFEKQPSQKQRAPYVGLHILSGDTMEPNSFLHARVGLRLVSEADTQTRW